MKVQLITVASFNIVVNFASHLIVSNLRRAYSFNSAAPWLEVLGTFFHPIRTFPAVFQKALIAFCVYWLKIIGVAGFSADGNYHCWSFRGTGHVAVICLYLIALDILTKPHRHIVDFSWSKPFSRFSSDSQALKGLNSRSNPASVYHIWDVLFITASKMRCFSGSIVWVLEFV